MMTNVLANVAFTDPQNNTWTDAVFKAATISGNQHESTDTNIRVVCDPANFTDYQDQSSPASHKNFYLEVQYYYWTSQANYDARGPLTTDVAPYFLADMTKQHRQTYWEISHEELMKDKYAGLEEVEIAMLFFQDEVLPRFQA